MCNVCYDSASFPGLMIHLVDGIGDIFALHQFDRDAEVAQCREAVTLVLDMCLQPISYYNDAVQVHYSSGAIMSVLSSASKWHPK